MADPKASPRDGTAGEGGLRARLAGIARRHGAADLYVFGSRATWIAARIGGISPPGPEPSDSDVDIGVRPRRGALFLAEDRVSLTLALEELLGVDRVDLVVLPEAGAFLALAAVSGELLYCDDPTEQAEYELFVLRQAGDLLPLERERRDLILRGGAR